MSTLKNLRRRYGRTSLTVTSVALAIAFTTIMLSIGEGISKSSQEILEETGVDLLAEPLKGPPLLFQFIPIFLINQSREIANSMVENNSKIRAAAPWLTKNMFVAKHPGEINASKPPRFASIATKGMIPEDNKYFGGVDILKGELLPTETDPFYANGTYEGGTNSENFTHEIIISQGLSKLMDISVGDQIYLNPVGLFDDFTNQSISEWYENATWFNISGIMFEQFEGQNALTARLHLSELQYITGEHKNDSANTIYIKLYDSSDIDEVKDWLKSDFYYKDRIYVYTMEDMMENIGDFMKLFEGISSMVLIITILIAALFISTILMISTRERTKEIGSLRAIGISKQTIYISIFKESLVICLLGLVVGIILGLIGAAWLNHYIISSYAAIPANVQIMVITPVLLIEVSLITLIIALLASLAPCYWAGKLNPVESIRME